MKLSPRYNETQFHLRNVPMNLDGFGVAWYEPEELFPRRVRSAAPVVDAAGEPHQVLKNVITGQATPSFLQGSGETCEAGHQTLPSGQRLESTTIFAHVREASTGDLKDVNSHPFSFDTLSFMHNGAIWGFDSFKEDLRASLRRETLALGEQLAPPSQLAGPMVYSLRLTCHHRYPRTVMGDTDSEHAGALFAQNLAGFPKHEYDLLSLRAAMYSTIAKLREFTRRSTTAEGSVEAPSSLNFAVTDGHHLVVSRYRSNPGEDPPTLYFKTLREGRAIVVSSEPDSSDLEALREWTLLGKDKLLSFSPSSGVMLECIDLESCDSDINAADALLAEASAQAEEAKEEL